MIDVVAFSESDLMRAVQAERKACAALVWAEYARHKAGEEECKERAAPTRPKCTSSRP